MVFNSRSDAHRLIVDRDPHRFTESVSFHVCSRANVLSALGFANVDQLQSLVVDDNLVGRDEFLAVAIPEIVKIVTRFYDDIRSASLGIFAHACKCLYVDFSTNFHYKPRI